MYDLVGRAMRTRVNRIPPALKHGAYAATSVLPGESRADFEKLHRNIIAELAPSGVLEDDIVMTIAHLVWRKQNLGTLRIAERAQNRCSAIEDENLYEYSSAERQELEQAAEDQARKELGDMYELVELGEAATFDGLTIELDIKERLGRRHRSMPQTVAIGEGS